MKFFFVYSWLGSNKGFEFAPAIKFKKQHYAIALRNYEESKIIASMGNSKRRTYPWG